MIILSAMARQPEVREATRAGRVTEALTKPFEIDRLVAVIAEATSR